MRTMNSTTRFKAGGAGANVPTATYATFPLSRAERWAQARADLVQGARAYPIWAVDVLFDMAKGFRRTIVGPYLPLLIRGVTLIVAGLLFHKLLDMRPERYFPHLIAGLVVWVMLSTIVNHSLTAFKTAREAIKQTGMPYSIHIYAAVWRAAIGFVLYLPIVVLAAGFFGRWLGWQALLAIPGIVLLCLNGVWAALVLATVSLRYKHIKRVIRRLMHMALVGTPILWKPNHFPDWQTMIEINPLHHCVEIVRGPLLGTTPPLLSWAVVAGMAAAGWLIALGVFAHYRRQIPFLV